MVSYHRVQYQKKLIVQSSESLVTDGRTDPQGGGVGGGGESHFLGRCRLTLSTQYKVVFGLFQKLFLKIYASQFMSICPFESGKCGKEGKKVQKFEYLENKRNFLDEIIYFFFSVFEGLSFGKKNKSLIKNHAHGRHLKVFFWHLLMNLKNKQSLKKLLSGPIKNKIILVFIMLHFFQKKKKKNKI